jgi:hypothetical protein
MESKIFAYSDMIFGKVWKPGKNDAQTRDIYLAVAVSDVEGS